MQYKNTGSYCRRSLLSSPLSRFSPSPLPFLSLPRRLFNIDKALKRKVFREGIPSQNLPGGRRLSTLANKNQPTDQLGNQSRGRFMSADQWKGTQRGNCVCHHPLNGIELDCKNVRNSCERSTPRNSPMTKS